MELLKEYLPLALRGSLFLLVLAVGMDSSMQQATFVIRQPRILLRSVFALAVVVPAFAALVVAVLPLEGFVKIGIMLMAVSPLPPFMPMKDISAGGRRRYVYGLLVAVSLLAVVMVPITVAILAHVFGTAASIGAEPVLHLLLVSIIIPFTAGMLIHHLAPERSEHAAAIVNKTAAALLLLCMLPILVEMMPAVWRLIGDGSVLTVVLVAVGALLAGHVLGGPDQQDRGALAIACTTRHPGVALLVAHQNFPEPQIKAVILLFLIVGVLVCLPYQVWFKRHRLAVP
jgi:BASS family bile acid:Na+ symporter